MDAPTPRDDNEEASTDLAEPRGAAATPAQLKRLLAQAEDRLAASEAINSSLGDGVLVIDNHGLLKSINKAGVALLGYEAAELVGRNIHACIHHHRPDGTVYPEAECPFVRVAVSGQTVTDVDEHFIRRDGSFVPVAVTAAPIRRDGRITGAVFIFRDTSERQAAAAALRAAENLRAAIFRASIDAIVTMDHQGLIVDWNPAAEHLFGYTRADAIGRPMAELIIPPRLRASHHRGVARFLATREGRVLGRPLEMSALRADGTEFAAELVITVIPDTEPPVFAGFVRDVTVIRERERTLRILFDVNQATMPLTEPAEITAVVARMLGEHLRVNRCAYAQVEPDEDSFVVTGDYVRDTFSMVGRFALSEFGAPVLDAMRRNEVYVSDDVMADPRAEGHRDTFARTDIRAVISVPLHKQGRLVAGMAVHQKVARRWTASEVELVQTVVGRCWESLERARGQKLIRESEERFRAVADNIAQLAWMADETGAIFWYNKRWYDFTGATFEQMHGWGWEAVHDPEHLPRVKEEFLRSIRAGTAWEDLFPLRGRDGAYRWFLSRAVPIRGEDGRVVRWFGTNTDVTELRETQQALRESEARHRLIVENVKDFAIISTDTTGTITYWNPGAERVFGWSEEEAVGQPVELIYTPEDRATGAAAREMQTARETGFALDERWHLHKDGRRLFVSGSLRPMLDDAGRLQGYHKAARDLTDRKQLEQQLMESQEHLEQLVRERTAKLEETIGELEAFSYSIAHDMRAPLRAMHQYAQIIEADYAQCLDATGVGHLRRIIAAAGRMDRLIQDILSYSRVTRAELRVEPVDLDAVVRQLIHEAPALRAPEADVAIEGRLPAVRAHEASLTQCVSNLLSNATKFVPPGVRPRVRIRAEERGEEVRLWVEDNGIGIPPEARERIFEIFVRIHSASEYAGTGIGLSIVRKAVERMGGEVGVESEPGRGSRFWIQLPRA